MNENIEDIKNKNNFLEDEINKNLPDDNNLSISNELNKLNKSNKNSDNNHAIPLPLPPIQNLNNLILKCVSNEEYCYSFIDFLKKMYHFKQIDYYLSYLNILYCFIPKELIEMSKMRKHLKNKYARDDPGFLLLIILYLFISSISYSLAFGYFSFFKIFNIFFIQSFVFLITFGLIISFISKILIDKYFNSNIMQTVEFIYAFDIHCNGFVPMYFFCIIIPYIFLPLCSKDYYFLQVLITNGLLCLGILYYCYNMFMGYFSLPFVRKNKYVTLMIWPIILFFLFSSLFRFNVYKYFISIFFYNYDYN